LIYKSREIACQELIRNIRNQSYTPDTSDLPTAEKQSDNLQLPSYIPYIGLKYFDYEPRILCYAINQNLSRHAPWSRTWINHWINNPDEEVDRLNSAAQNGIPIPIKPYAEGFIPLIALIALNEWLDDNKGVLPCHIDDVIAVTNFVKYSTVLDASSTSIPQMWWKQCADKFVRHEIEVLAPDLIIAFGQRTYSELAKLLVAGDTSKKLPKLMKCRFPARIASINSRTLTGEEREIWDKKISPLHKRIRRPHRSPCHKFKIENYPGYFLDFYRSLRQDKN